MTSPTAEKRPVVRLAGLALALAVAACASPEPEPAGTSPGAPTGDDRPASSDPRSGCADVTAVDVSTGDEGLLTFRVTVVSADTGWEKYADAWEVRDPSGSVLGIRELAHPHVDEQPFTRSLSGVEIPPGIERVVVAARDSVEGFCGSTMEVALPAP